MTAAEEGVLSSINLLIREEHGSSVKLTDMWRAADVDSFGSTMVFLELDDKHGCFGKDWLSSVKGEELTVKELVDRIIDAS